ncbi:MAG TPA: hypothetical protein VNS52_11610 [Gemmatimonadaceae bacterium]|nr:hypothetical protein [Gemmatimonadaceae bacterium]
MSTPSIRALSSALALGAGLAVAACNGDQAAATGPVVRGASVASETQLATVLQRSVPLEHAISASITVADNGGVLRIPEAGLQVVVPRNALPTSTPVTITVTAIAGNAVAYEFEPHGLVFARPLSATQDLSGTTWSASSGRATPEAAYFAGDEQLDVAAGTALISETFRTDLVATGKRLHWGIPHFSGYVIVTGRGGPPSGNLPPQ